LNEVVQLENFISMIKHMHKDPTPAAYRESLQTSWGLKQLQLRMAQWRLKFRTPAGVLQPEGIDGSTLYSELKVKLLALLKLDAAPDPFILRCGYPSA
jgi:hypothetical protein